MRFILPVVLAVCLAIVSVPALASDADTCAQLVSYGRGRLGSVEDETLRAQISSLLDQAEQQCNGGSVSTGIETAKSAIEMIK